MKGNSSVIKQMTTALIAMSVFTASTAMAKGPPPCERGKTAGSYIRLRDDRTPTFIDQLVLHSDGTAYWHQSTALESPLTGVNGGTSIPEIGTWNCVDEDTLVVTVIGENYHSEQSPDPDDGTNILRDFVPDARDRLTLRLDVQDRDTLVRNYFIERQFALTVNPLDPASVPLEPPNIGTNTPVYKRVPVLTSDILP